MVFSSHTPPTHTQGAPQLLPRPWHTPGSVLAVGCSSWDTFTYSRLPSVETGQKEGQPRRRRAGHTEGERAGHPERRRGSHRRAVGMEWQDEGWEGR